ncbi:MAG: BMP family ABC transporter substrate-binding protein [Tissierella sp.]|uniref:BMP family ABC transporter substrate-binding protein n=1 Tax=Tissierella sp. TaxID=41274 RepID=UPI003F9C857B
MKKILALLLSMTLMASVFVGCSSDSDDGGSSDGDEDKVKIALLTDEAGTQVFVLNMINALEENADKYGYEAVIAESGDAAAYEANGRALIEEEVDFIIGGSWQAGEAMEKIATEFPDAAEYAMIDTELANENIKSISYREQEGAYLIGMVAAMSTEDDEEFFGGVHANQGAGSWRWRYGFMEGAKSIKPDSEFVFNYVGGYNDPAKAKELAIQQYEQGATFINAAAAGGDKGVFEAALEKEFYTSGQDVDLTTPDNPYIITSQIKDTYTTIEYLLEKYFSDEEWSEENEEWGIEEGVIGAVHVTHESENEISDRLSEENIEKLKQVAEDIKSGELDMKDMPKEDEYKK